MPAPSPLADDKAANPIGPAMAAILAGAEALRGALSHPAAFQLNALSCQPGMTAPEDAPLIAAPSRGALWFVGLGSVGTTVLYFLSLDTRDFSARLFDMDKVKDPQSRPLTALRRWACRLEEGRGRCGLPLRHRRV